MKLEITTPDNLIYSGNIEQATLPGELGEFGVLPGHAPLISTLKTGIITISDTSKNTAKIFVADGFAEVNPEETSVLAGEAYNLEKITKDEAIEKLEQAKLRLKLAENDFDKTLANEQIELFGKLVSCY